MAIPRKPMSSGLLLAACVLALLSAGDDRPGPSPPVKILFIGNSYSGAIQKILTAMLDRSPHAAQVRCIAPGGWTLARHAANPGTLAAIRGDWDYVVLQEQSQVPSLPGEHQESYYKAVQKLCTAIKQSGARPVLYLTWARRDGDPQNPQINPDFATMQDRLTQTTREAARRNDALVVPVGEAWRAVRTEHPDLGAALYAQDGSHPSPQGSYLAACVFLRSLLNAEPTDVTYRGRLEKDTAQTLRDAAFRLAGPR